MAQRSGAAAVPVVRLHGRAGCHLCDEAQAGLEAMQAAGTRFSLELVDIESDPELLRRQLERIPVVEVEGEEVCSLGLDKDAVRARLATVA